MVRARNQRNQANVEKRPVVAFPQAVEANNAADIPGQRPLRFMALIWGIPVLVVILSLVVRRFLLNG